MTNYAVELTKDFVDYSSIVLDDDCCPRLIQFHQNKALVGFHSVVEPELLIDYCKMHGFSACVVDDFYAPFPSWANSTFEYYKIELTHWPMYGTKTLIAWRSLVDHILNIYSLKSCVLHPTQGERGFWLVVHAY